MDGRELKLYNARLGEAQFLRDENRFLRGDRDHFRLEYYFIKRQVNVLKARVEKLEAENSRLHQRVKELSAAPEASRENSTPDWVKPSAARRRRKKPGRKAGHPAALRPMPDRIDVHHDAPLPVDGSGRESCPRCNACLLELADHNRVVEDIIPEKVLVKCCHTRSGWCPGCRRRVESRAPDQPPAANVPHGQLGINALATAIVLRVTHRLPFRQVARVLADLPGLSICPGAIAKQVQRAAGWFAEDYDKLLLELRSSPQVYSDETGWRTNGRNGYLWALTDPRHTLYHVDKTRSGKVIVKLLGKAFGGTLVSDFYSAYAKMDCKKQKCLVHLLRELSESAQKSEAFATGMFYRQSKRLLKEMLLLKSRWDALGDSQYTSRVCRLETRLDQLTQAIYDEPHARRIGKRMLKYRKELTAFLWDKDLEGTNNAAERAIRPAVVARKISGGSRSKNGADAWAKLASLLRTARQQGKNLLETVKAMLQSKWASGMPPAMPAAP
jgi:transposase